MCFVINVASEFISRLYANSDFSEYKRRNRESIEKVENRVSPIKF